MKKQTQHKELKGLPGGPNEIPVYTTGVFSIEGFRMDSPDVNNYQNIIPSGSITMKEKDGSPLRKGPLLGVDNLGNEQIMYPGYDYQFPGTEVTETLIAKMGGALLDKTIKCGNCGWEWKAADGGSDIMDCHKCGGKGIVKAQAGTEVKKPLGGGKYYTTTGKIVDWGTPEYEVAYNRGEVLSDDGTPSEVTMQGGKLDEVVVKNKYKRNFLEKYRDKIIEENKDAGPLGAIIGTPLSAITSLPQLAATYAITGKVERPSEAMDIQNPYGAMTVDAIADPANLVGLGLLTKEKALAELSNLKNINSEGKIFNGVNKELNNIATKNIENYMSKRIGSDTPLPKELEPYISRVGEPSISRDEEVFRNVMGHEYRQAKELQNTKFLDSEGNVISAPNTSQQEFYYGETPITDRPLPQQQQGGEKEDTSWTAYLNPANWGTSRYDDAGTFKEAFRAARTEGDTDFLYKGDRYSTELKPTVTPDKPQGITPDLLIRQAYRESKFNPNAVSPKGYKGIGQIGDSIIKDYKKANNITGDIDPFNMKQNSDVQKYSMNELYNSSVINKPNQSEEVRLAKTLASYNWGRGNVTNLLNDLKEEGVDIYNSLDWVTKLPKEPRNYINDILLQKNSTFNTDFSKALGNQENKQIKRLYGFRDGGESKPGALMIAYNRLPKEKKMGGAIVNKKEFGGQLISNKEINKNNITMYKDYVKGNIGNEIEVVKNYDKLNRIYYTKAKELGMTASNYIMTYIVDNS